MRWLMGLWQRMTHRHMAAAPPAPPAPPAALRRDPDLDALHRAQHDLIRDSGYAAAKIRDSWNEWVQRSWRPDAT